LLTTAEKKGINMDKTLPRLQTSQKNDAGNFTIILISLMSNGRTQLKKSNQVSYCKKKLQIVAKSFRIKMITHCCGR